MALVAAVPRERIPAVLLALSARLINDDGEPAPEARRPPLTSDLVDAVQMANRLGVPPSWVRYETRAGRLPSVRIGRYVRYRPADVEAALAARGRNR